MPLGDFFNCGKARDAAAVLVRLDARAIAAFLSLTM